MYRAYMEGAFDGWNKKAIFSTIADLIHWSMNWAPGEMSEHVYDNSYLKLFVALMDWYIQID